MIAYINDPEFFVLKCKTIAPNITYEDFLLEVLNASFNFFSYKHPFTEKFVKLKNQSNGEDDAYTSTYSIDFKLLINQEYMHAMDKNKPSVDLKPTKEGIVFVKTKPNKVPVDTRNIILEIAQLTEEDIETNRCSKSIDRLLNNLEKEKHLLLYYPYEFSSGGAISGNFFINLFNKSMKTIMDYRVKKVHNKDTFLCIKANKEFYIYEWTAQGFILRDQVNEILCSTYMQLKQCACLYA